MNALLLNCLPVYFCTCLHVYLFTSQLICCLYLFTHLLVYLSNCQPIYMSTCQPSYPYICQLVYLLTCLPVHLSICLSVICVSIFLNIYESIVIMCKDHFTPPYVNLVFNPKCNRNVNRPINVITSSIQVKCYL